MAAEFHSVLLATYIPAVGCLGLGLFWLSAAVATGRTLWPRWFALIVNPVSIGLLTIGGPHLLSGTLAYWLGCAAFNTTWLVIFTVSTRWLWNATPEPVAPCRIVATGERTARQSEIA
jgi:hypothetical protein